MKSKFGLFLFCAVLALFPVETLFAQGTAFTYQGRLNNGSSPASGSYDLTFTIYDSLSSPTNVMAGPITNSATAISNGLFTVTLDFGGGVFNGNPRYLEIGVRTNGASSFAILSPRQLLTATPYAITAGNVTGVVPSAGVSGTYGNTVAFNNSANQFTGGFTGNGAGLTNLNATQLASGTVADARLSANVALLNANQTFSGANAFTNFGNSFRGSFFGNGLVGWIPTNGTAIQAVIDTGYLLTNPQPATVTLPASPGVGDIVRISGPGAGGWKVAQNAGQSILGNFSSFANSPWTLTQAANTWYGIASSADGSRLAAVANGVGIFTSINSGISWNNSTPFAAQWRSIASSADGNRLVAAIYGGGVYTNSGTSWAVTGSGSANWISVASSADGTKLFAAIYGGGVYSSINAGASWTITGAGSANWVSVTCSADGSKFAAAASGGGIFASGGSGAPGANWASVTMSADGNKLAAAVGGGGIYTSSNGGATWTLQSGAPTSANWASIDSSSDGSKLAAAVNGGGIYTSSTFGVAWTQQTNAPIRNWSSIASSADGTKLAAVVNNATTGGIYVSEATLQTTTTVGTTGYIIGGQGAAVELQYIGNNQFMPVSVAGNIWAN